MLMNDTDGRPLLPLLQPTQCFSWAKAAGVGVVAAGLLVYAASTAASATASAVGLAVGQKRILT